MKVFCAGQVPACRAAASVWGQKWRQQAVEVRASLNLPPASKPWTSMPGLAVSSIPASERHMSDVDQAAKMKWLCRALITDVSQNPARRPQTNQQGRSRCLTTSSRLYSHGQARMVTAFEFFRFQGHDLRVQIPDSISQKQAADLAGEGIALPCLATIVFCLQATECFLKA